MVLRDEVGQGGVVEGHGGVALGCVGHKVDGLVHGADTHIGEQGCSRMMVELHMVEGLGCSHTLVRGGGVHEGHMGLGLGHSGGLD